MKNVQECIVSSNISSNIPLCNHPRVPNLVKFRLVDIYTNCTEGEAIVESFCNPSGNLRIVIGTVAYAMGLDCPHIILWGPPYHLTLSHSSSKQDRVVETDFLPVH